MKEEKTINKNLALSIWDTMAQNGKILLSLCAIIVIIFTIVINLIIMAHGAHSWMIFGFGITGLFHICLIPVIIWLLIQYIKTTYRIIKAVIKREEIIEVNNKSVLRITFDTLFIIFYHLPILLLFLLTLLNNNN